MNLLERELDMNGITDWGKGYMDAIHDAMEKQVIDNFTFEVIERVEKENLSSREKFWIEFYGADRYGFNMKAGG